MNFPKFFFNILISQFIFQFSLGCKDGSFKKDSSKSAKSQLEAEARAEKDAAAQKGVLIPRVESASGDPAAQAAELGDDASIATDVTGAYLTLPQGMISASKPVSLFSAEKIKDTMSKSWTMYLAFNGVAPENLAIIYQIVDESGQYFYGIIPKKDLVLNGETIAFHPQGLGIYQAAILPISVPEARQVPIPKADVGPQLNLWTIFKTKGPAQDMVLMGDKLYIAEGDGFEIAEFEENSQFNSVKRIDAPFKNLSELVALGDSLYFVAGNDGLAYFNLTDKPGPIQFFKTYGITNGIALDGNKQNIYLTQNEFPGDSTSLPGIARYSILPNGRPNESTGYYDSVQDGNMAMKSGIGLDINGSTAIVLNRTGILPFNISQFDNIIRGSVYSSNPTTVNKICLSNGQAFASGDDGKILVLGVSDTNIISESSIQLTAKVADLKVKDKYLLVSASDPNGKLLLYDASNPKQLSLKKSISLDNAIPSKIRIFGNYIFVAAGDKGVYVFTIN
ncbi:MAG: hypothetical protein NTX25_19315 [Proteobacteria bacterium]|nr:hypothetical protein [Pseudomonadota bacterium]